MTKDDVLAKLNVSRETTGRLERYVALIKKWNPKINLISKSSMSELWNRHIMDSAQLFGLYPKGIKQCVDLGSGGGFPGLVISILAAEKMPDVEVTLVESDLRKSAFLRTVAQDCALNTIICADRIEDIDPLGVDVLSARALAPLPKLLEYAQRHLAKNGKAIFPKGATYETELTESLERWRFSVQKQPSVTDPNSVILCIGDIERA